MMVGSTATHSLPKPEARFLTQPFESLTKTCLWILPSEVSLVSPASVATTT